MRNRLQRFHVRFGNSKNLAINFSLSSQGLAYTPAETGSI